MASKEARAQSPRLGRQTPTRSVILPYPDTLGQEAVDHSCSTCLTL